MRNPKTKTYHVFVELDIILKEGSLVAHTGDGIAAAVRHALRKNLPISGFMQAGYKFDANTIHAIVADMPASEPETIRQE